MEKKPLSVDALKRVKARSKRNSPETRRWFKSREMKILRGYSEAMKAGENKSLRQCAIEAGVSPNYATASAQKIYRVLSKNEALCEAMERHGIGVASLVSDMSELRKATLPGKDGHPDNFIRFKNVELRSKLLDVVPSQKVEVARRSISINITADTLEKIKELKGPEELRRLLGE